MRAVITSLVSNMRSRRARAAGNDPAPSRLYYRLERLWLTPVFKSLVRTGIPTFSCVLFVLWYIGDAERFEAIAGQITETRRAIEERPEFMVNAMRIEGATAELSQDISEVLPIDLPISQFALDLEQIRATLEELDPVAAADVRLLTGGLLSIAVTERAPEVIYQGANGFELLAGDGLRVASIESRAARSDLPLIAGVGAPLAAEEALRLLEAAEPIEEMIIGMVRIGERRWDMNLSGGRKIMLPAEDPGLALDRALALHGAQDVLLRGVEVLDYRNALRPTVRMTEVAQKEWRRIKNLELLSSENSQ